jgi:hypothetical protein
MLRMLGRMRPKGYYFLLSVAVGGLLGANLAGLLRGAWTFNAQHAPDPDLIRAWTHRGWIVGAVLMFPRRSVAPPAIRAVWCRREE